MLPLSCLPCFFFRWWKWETTFIQFIFLWQTAECFPPSLIHVLKTCSESANWKVFFLSFSPLTVLHKWCFPSELLFVNKEPQMQGSVTERDSWKTHWFVFVRARMFGVCMKGSASVFAACLCVRWRSWQPSPNFYHSVFYRFFGGLKIVNPFFKNID